MRKLMFNYRITVFVFFVASVFSPKQSLAAEKSMTFSEELLRKQYDLKCTVPSDIYEHVHHLCRLAKNCSSAVQIGSADFNPSWGILQGLKESCNMNPTFFVYDTGPGDERSIDLLNTISRLNDISFSYIQTDDFALNLDSVDLLFLDGLHTYAHVTYQLEKFNDQVGKYIALHDTGESFGFKDCPTYKGDYSEYPTSINRNKRGLWRAVWDFLNSHPEWELAERYYNNNGFTILRRKGVEQ